MVTSDSVKIGFADSQVSVVADASMRGRLKRRFALMLDDDDSNVIAHFEIRRTEGSFKLFDQSGCIAVEQNTENVIEALIHKIAERFILVFPSLLWFHAAVMARNEQAIMLPALWGNGKSSLAVALANEGWTYLSDDLAPLDPGTNRIIPYPRTPTVRSHSGHQLPRERISELPKTETRSAEWSTATHPVALQSVIFPQYQFEGGCELLEYKPADAVVELLSHCLNFSDAGGAAVSHLAQLMPNIDSYQLPFSDARTAALLLTAAFQLPDTEATG